MYVVKVFVQQVLIYVLVTVINVLVQVQAIAVQQMPVYVLETVMSVQVLAQHITVQQVMLFVQIQLPHVTVQAVVQCLIVSHVLTLMVFADLRLVAVMFVGIILRRIMGINVQLVSSVAVVLVFL